MNLSASELVKCSASQLLYKLTTSVSTEPTERQIEGDKYAHSIIQQEKAAAEKRGIVQLDDEDRIFFCVDMVQGKKFIEIKMVQQYEEWFLHQSLLQACFYATLLKQVDTLDTPVFRRKLGYKQEIIKVPKKHEFELWFGDEHFKVKPNKKIINHYFKKARLVLDSIEDKDYDACRAFDAQYKHKEFSIYKIDYQKI